MEIDGIFIEIERKSIKNLHLSVYPPDARVHVSAPIYLDDNDIRSFVLSKWEWLEKQKERILSQERQSAREYVSGESYYHSEKVSYESFANNGKLTIEAMVDYEHVNKYLDLIVDIIKDLREEGIYENKFENEKNAYLIKFLQENEKAADISRNAAREVAINKQSFSLASELMKVELLSVSDANKILEETFDFTKLYIAYLGNPVDIRALDYVND